MNTHHLILHDSGKMGWEQRPPGLIVHWAKRSVPDGEVSLPLLVDQQDNALRAEYLAWIYTFGEIRFGGRSVREWLAVNDGLTFWWLGNLTEKSPIKTPWIFDVLKLRALELLYNDSDCREIILYSGNKILHRILARWCLDMGIPFRWVQQPTPLPTVGFVSYWFRRLPHLIQALVMLGGFIWNRWRHIIPAQPPPQDGQQVMVANYFPNYDADAAKQGIFRSRYWGPLHEILDNGPWTINWMLVYAGGDQDSFVDAIKQKACFQRQAGGKARYYFPEEFLRVKDLLRAIGLFARVVWRGWRLGSVISCFHLPGSRINFWPLAKTDWMSSIFGRQAMHSSLGCLMWRRSLESIGSQTWGLYIWENQIWEKIMLSNWRQLQTGKLVGAQHSILCYWDLRNLEDARSHTLSNFPPPLPDLLAINGNMSKNRLLQVGFPRHRLIEVEAVRFQYFQDMTVGKFAVPLLSEDKENEDNTLLIVSSLSGYRRQFEILSELAKRGALDRFTTILVKPHPLGPLNDILQELGLRDRVTISYQPLSELWGLAAMVYAANHTSTSLEAVCNGLPTIHHLGFDGMNLSHSYDIDGVTFCTDADCVEKLLTHPSVLNVDVHNIFFFSTELYRWDELISVLQTNSAAP
jgi:surface carbohydrate biosynthesis protein (TIGR04326 family)